MAGDAAFSCQNSQGGRTPVLSSEGTGEDTGPYPVHILTRVTQPHPKSRRPESDSPHSRSRQAVFKGTHSSLGWRAGHNSRCTLCGRRAAGHCVRGAPHRASHPLHGGPDHSPCSRGSTLLRPAWPFGSLSIQQRGITQPCKPQLGKEHRPASLSSASGRL